MFNQIHCFFNATEIRPIKFMGRNIVGIAIKYAKHTLEKGGTPSTTNLHPIYSVT